MTSKEENDRAQQKVKANMEAALQGKPLPADDEPATEGSSGTSGTASGLGYPGVPGAPSGTGQTGYPGVPGAPR